MSFSIDAECRPLLIVALIAVLGGAPAPSARAEAEASDPRIAVGDVLELRVWREPDLSGEHRVGPDGRLHHVLAGAVRAAGRSPEELERELRERLERDYLRQARVSVSVVESVHRRASVVGAVESPGQYPIRPETRLLDLLFTAGGLAEAAEGTATLLRHPPSEVDETSAERFEVDLHALLAGDLSENRRVLPGDMLVVAASSASVGAGPTVRGPRIRVVGEVKRPGSYPLRDAASVLDAVLAAGGLGEYAAANRSRLVREQEGERVELRVRIEDALQGKPDANLALRDGDLLIVPESFF